MKVISWNVWFDRFEAETRWNSILGICEEENPDFICFQEVTDDFLKCLKKNAFFGKFYCSYRKLASTYDTIMLWKTEYNCKPSRESLPSKLGRNLLYATARLEQSTFVIATSHLESMKPNHSLRRQQLETILKKFHASENVIVCGDFNFCSTWKNENDLVENSEYIDVWAQLRPSDPGFTEDTNINKMLWKAKRTHKTVRFDRILVKSNSWQSTKMELLGVTPLDKGESVWPSDHFGVCATFEPVREKDSLSNKN